MTYIFTAHNIELDDGTHTLPSNTSICKHDLFLAAERTLNVIYGNNLAGKSIADIGCLEGGYATAFARLGMNSTGIEVRESNFQNCLFVKSKTNLENLKFIKDDAMNIADHGPFDGLFVCGLLYHLDKPCEFLEKAASVCKKFIIIDTHVAPLSHEPAVDIYKLSDVQTNEGYTGRWYPEYDEVPADILDAMRWTSWSNNKSFWLDKHSLLQVLKKAGFNMVFEQFDCEPNILDGYGVAGMRARASRVFIVGIKTDTASVDE